MGVGVRKLKDNLNRALFLLHHGDNAPVEGLWNKDFERAVGCDVDARIVKDDEAYPDEDSLPFLRSLGPSARLTRKSSR